MTKEIEKLAEEKYPATFPSGNVWLDDNNYALKRVAFIAGYQAALTNQVSWVGMQWISVEDRLPKNGERVLGYSEDYERSECVVFKDEDFWMTNDMGDLESFEFSDSVTHWMPLPYAPDDESSPKTPSIDPDEMAVGLLKWVDNNNFKRGTSIGNKLLWYSPKEGGFTDDELLQLFKLSPEYKSLTKK